ncbi:MAG TPA: dienelactone hydrolase family protein [Chitinophagaceae bacterium]|nr:dienelactone hydrolase family protein [Chitinophagaceae bacterium]
MKYILSLLLSIHAFVGEAQSMICCNKPGPSATTAFAMLGGNKEFLFAHAVPLPFILAHKTGKEIRFPTPDGRTGGGYFIKAAHPTHNYLLVFHEYWGLNDYIRQMAQKLGMDIGHINVLALDLYDGKVATTPEMAGKYMQAVKDIRARAIISGALKYAGKDARIYTIGWCFGGGWSLQATLMAGSQAGGCVMYYGMPEKDVDRLKTLHADVLGIFANKDAWINPTVVNQFVTNMAAAHKTLIVKRYNADHAFANPSNPHHDESATTDAYKATLAFFRERVKG